MFTTFFPDLHNLLHKGHTLKYTKKITIPKYTNACGAEIMSVFLSSTKMIEATRQALVGLQIDLKKVLVIIFRVS